MFPRGGTRPRYTARHTRDMPFHIPFLSRLHLREYLALFLSFVLIILESFIALITRALPSPIINLCYGITSRVFNHLSSPSSLQSREKKKGIWSAVANASDFTELCELWGYTCEEHIVQTGDGYLLGLHRLSNRAGEENVRVNAGKGSVTKKVVYLHHGLMMNSEVWVCLTERERCLPFQLVERGYDVWLGNNRGNKYSKKSVHTAPTSSAFWDFSIDQFAFHDIPDSIDYILETTRQPSLSYIGFSQGTAQAFATLSIHPTLNDKVNLFIALAPAMSPPGLTSGIVDSFVKTSPDILYLAFGRKSILPSTTMWQSILYPPIFVRVIDAALRFLFGWSAVNILPDQKLAAYPHLYSYTSTKSVVHWFQIIRNGVFQMYDDEAPSPLSNRSKYYKVAKFPTRNIKTPIVLMYGGTDSLVDIKIMLKELPRHTTAKEIPHYEHLDFLWAQSVDKLVFPHVFAALDKHAGSASLSSDSERDERSQSSSRRRRLLPGPEAPGPDAGPSSPTTPAALRAAKKVSQTTRRAALADSTILETETEHIPAPQPESAQLAMLPDTEATFAQAIGHNPSPSQATTIFSPTSIKSPPTSVKAPSVKTPSVKTPTRNVDSPVPSLDASHMTNQSSTSRPEGWWSSDEVGGDDVGGTEPSAPSTPPPPKFRRKMSERSVDSANLARFGNKGITLGVGRAVSGIVGMEGFAMRGDVSGEGLLERGQVRNSVEDGKRRKKAVRSKSDFL
ncbi:alpha/beta-hydrolase [Dothidotthia symphoricarpi CBS 119687]|uniref:Alpha/beta-hydrolase n=1 Tax=Dothidotthia symphoricarpi CBS 119687 TaxID=1392245 RepID=A0A6A6AWS5_9PLEO|nr:alpha/beta-hydrolase [Dothidotthia symphoricarpi CBS 119687]KAF2134981.1 alpha/beta-hydrolase [Dothidotthia symphoricarpi CBS 119687]